jgi:hypothetical protein
MENWRHYLKEGRSNLRSPLTPEEIKFLQLASNFDKKRKVQEDVSLLFEQELDEGKLEDWKNKIKALFQKKLDRGESKKEISAEIENTKDPNRRELLFQILGGVVASAATAATIGGVSKALEKPPKKPKKRTHATLQYTPTASAQARQARQDDFEARKNAPAPPDLPGKGLMPRTAGLVEEFEWSPSPKAAPGFAWVTPDQISDNFILPYFGGGDMTVGEYKERLAKMDIKELDNFLYGGILRTGELHPNYNVEMLPISWSKGYEFYSKMIREQIRILRSFDQSELEQLSKKTGKSVEDILSDLEKKERLFLY